MAEESAYIGMTPEQREEFAEWYGARAEALGCADLSLSMLERVQLSGGERHLAARVVLEGELPMSKADDLETLTEEVTARLPELEVKARAVPAAGDELPHCGTLTTLDGAKVSLARWEGQVLLLDFWATWCGPCQPVMAHNADIMKRRAADWAGKAALITISIDNMPEEVKARLSRAGWGSLADSAVWAGPGGWESGAAAIYRLSAVPTLILVNKDGVIVKRGSPAKFDVEADIDALLAEE
eukprot:PLAT9746.1.p2 GENE.PLAT9746.1~~PLAT9746.1.p2  ORF type:complete len:250 (-),score=132.36 PLAT9746.1:102-824(-)